MCKLASWIEKSGKVYFLSDYELSTREGKELIKYTADTTDLLGHGAIRKYFSLEGGEDKECTDFSKASNFPAPIVKMIKEGKFRKLGVVVPQLLNEKARNQYQEVEGKARNQYQEVEGKAWKQYREVKGKAWKQYEEVVEPAYKQYKEVEQGAFWDLYQDLENRVEEWR